MFIRVALLILKKDFAIEVKSREILYTTLFFAISCVMVFSFAFVGGDSSLNSAAAGILWIAISFAGNLALGRTFERERYGETLRALLLAPAPRTAIYAGKLLGIVILLLVTEIILVPLISFLFDAPLLAQWWLLTGLLVSGTIGFAAVGTLFAAMLVRTRSRAVLLPILLYPIVIPVIIAGVRGTAALLASPVDTGTAIMWIGIVASFDAVFLTLSLWTFETLMTD